MVGAGRPLLPEILGQRARAGALEALRNALYKCSTFDFRLAPTSMSLNECGNFDYELLYPVYFTLLTYLLTPLEQNRRF